MWHLLSFNLNCVCVLRIQSLFAGPRRQEDRRGQCSPGSWKDGDTFVSQTPYMALNRLAQAQPSHTPACPAGTQQEQKACALLPPSKCVAAAGRGGAGALMASRGMGRGRVTTVASQASSPSSARATSRPASAGAGGAGYLRSGRVAPR